jgi:hypothetical protein
MNPFEANEVRKRAYLHQPSFLLLLFSFLQDAATTAAAPLLGEPSTKLDPLNPWASNNSDTSAASKPLPGVHHQSAGQTSTEAAAAASASAQGPRNVTARANWPRCCPCARIDIDSDIQSLYKGIVRTAYIAMLFAMSAAFLNTVATLVLWLAPHTPSGPLKTGTNFAVSWIYSIVVPAGAFAHFKYLYDSMRFPSPGRNTCYMVFLFLGVAFDIIALVGIPKTALCGVWAMASVLHKDVKGPTEVQSIVVIAVVALFCIHLCLLLWLARLVHRARNPLGALSI